ncbi:uncharacterized protein M421DRAFT_3346 [Didymella exigua CBS 183.55]|uniref:Uncharacterized protein n=1 Tax=Didymella exigua CBS 183.55 TaxID=1150837 RepID=A0A6A5RPD8_9PLEO|nr:uncharacterized protein M421DRAFT_3346 [Didymella exigua CBS 183.55]KAF1930265.1 hypothetical protein M421DRAFT_3346 [Didymella exigua CBS 183.55]
MSRNEKEELPPSYTEVPNFSRLNAHRGQQILDQLTLTRAHHIQLVIDTHIIPLVEERASYGIAQTTIAMLPSDIPLPAVQEKSEFSFDTDTSKAVEVLGFASEEEPNIVRLEGQMNRTEFWRVQAVIVELERVLRDSLNASPQLGSPIRERSEFEGPHKMKRSLLAKFIGRGEKERSPSGNPELGVKKADESGLVLVKARLEEISLRTMSDFGLYDTMSKQCVIIRIDARC